MAYLKQQDLSKEMWLSKLQNLSPAEAESWILQETHLACCLERFHASQIDENSYRGRVFSPSGEWKWRLLPNGDYRCVFLGDKDWSELSEDGSNELAQLQSAFCDIVLWGKYQNERKVWLEQKIPRHFEYPTSGIPRSNDRVLLGVEKWQERNHSRHVHFVRYRELKNQKQGE